MQTWAHLPRSGRHLVYPVLIRQPQPSKTTLLLSDFRGICFVHLMWLPAPMAGYFPTSLGRLQEKKIKNVDFFKNTSLNYLSLKGQKQAGHGWVACLQSWDWSWGRKLRQKDRESNVDRLHSEIILRSKKSER